MEILNRREQIKAAAIPPEIANPTTLVTTSDKASKSKAGIVKIGDGINVNNGVISVAGGGGNFFDLGDIGDTLSAEALATFTSYVNAAMAGTAPLTVKVNDPTVNVPSLTNVISTWVYEAGDEPYDTFTVLSVVNSGGNYTVYVNLTTGKIAEDYGET